MSRPHPDQPASQQDDPVAALAVEAILRAAPYSKSVLIFGSRASAQPAPLPGTADYDIVVVVPSCRTLSAVRGLNGAAARVREQTGAKLAINPVPALRLRRARGNFMALKLARESRPLWGAAPGEVIGDVNEGQIGQFWHFFYLASQAKRLMDACPIEPAVRPAPQAADAVTYAAAKAIVACGELRVLAAHKKYVSDPAGVAAALSDAGDGEWASRVSEARAWLTGTTGADNAWAHWAAARGAVLETGEFLAAQHFQTGFLLDRRFERQFLRSAGFWKTPRNLQFAALSLLEKRIRLRAALSCSGVAERVKLATFYMLSSAHGRDEIDRAALEKAETLVSGLTGVSRAGSAEERWAGLRDSLGPLYAKASVALGL